MSHAWMRLLLVVVAALAMAPATLVCADNKYPIVLVHGFAGWGRDEALGLKYWGGIQGDLQEQLKSQGFTVYTAAVGPFSSNWDRACELYAQIKGGQVDYGKNHAAKHGHKQLGRTFPGLYPEWGNVVNGKVNKVHLIGHSMGGQTIRMLTQMLQYGTMGAPVTEASTSHALFNGGKDWVHSITTISTPNQGTILADGFSQIGDLVKDVVIGALSILGVAGSGADVLYDAKLDQWGLEPKRSGESLSKYVDRVFASPIFKPGFKDISIWSLSTSGAAEESTWVQTLPNVYYYSFATMDTYAWRDWLFRKIQLPNLLTMLLPMQPVGVFLGGRYGPNHGFSDSWQPNDGVVNTVSMNKDAVGQSRTFSGASVQGLWNVMPQLARLDHLAVVGITLHTQIKNVYVAQAKLLYSLPEAAAVNSMAESLRMASAASPDVVAELQSSIEALNTAAASVNTKEDLEIMCASPANEYAVNYCERMLLSTETHTSPTRSLRA